MNVSVGGGRASIGRPQHPSRRAALLLAKLALTLAFSRSRAASSARHPDCRGPPGRPRASSTLRMALRHAPRPSRARKTGRPPQIAPSHGLDWRVYVNPDAACAAVCVRRQLLLCCLLCSRGSCCCISCCLLCCRLLLLLLLLPVLLLPVLSLPVLSLPVLSLPVLSLPVLSLPALAAAVSALLRRLPRCPPLCVPSRAVTIPALVIATVGSDEPDCHDPVPHGRHAPLADPWPPSPIPVSSRSPAIGLSRSPVVASRAALRARPSRSPCPARRPWPSRSLPS